MTDSSKLGYALLNAVLHNKLDTARELLKAKAPLHWVVAKNHNSALHCAVANNNPDMIALLLMHGADASMKNKAGKTAIQVASEKSHWKCVSAFSRFKDVDHSGEYGTALIDAVIANRLNTANELLNANASPAWKTCADGNTALHHAVLKSNPDMISLLLKFGADTASINKDGKTPVQLAADKKSWKCIGAFSKFESGMERKPSVTANGLWKMPSNQSVTIDQTGLSLRVMR